MSERQAAERGEYPEHEKLAAISGKSQAIGEFIDFGGYTLCTYKEAPDVPGYIDSRTGTDQTPLGRKVSITADHTVRNPEWYPSGYYAEQRPIASILAEYFGIDQGKIEAEKRAMLDRLRERAS